MAASGMSSAAFVVSIIVVTARGIARCRFDLLFHDSMCVRRAGGRRPLVAVPAPVVAAQLELGEKNK
jgi:hypothetical protein